MQENLKHVSELIDKAVLADLDLGSIQGRTDEEIAATYNGCGPAWFPTLAREKLTKLLGLFEPAFMIHDSDFEHADGSTFDFSQANDRLELNCLKLAAHAYPWYSWRRWRAQAAAIEIASLCRRYGWSAYCSGRGATAAEIHESQFQKLPNSETPSSESNHAKTIPCMLYALLISLALTGCMRSIEVIKEGDDWRASYTSLGLKTDVDSIEVEKKSDGFIRVKVKGLVTDVSEENKEVVAATGTAVGNIAEKVVEGVIEGAK